MNTSEFRDIELQIREEKLLRIKWDEQRKRSMVKQRYRAKMERPRINYIPKGLSVDYEEEYSKYLMQEVSFEPRDNDDFMAQLRLLERWHKKSIPQILAKNRPDAAYGSPWRCASIYHCSSTETIYRIWFVNTKGVLVSCYLTVIRLWWLLSRLGTMRRRGRRYVVSLQRRLFNTQIIGA
ncbi:hypothetical protein [Segatella copri]|uniref:Uncharacterized protein n=1 Tax=Segatella copri TaxID=165179 RepID=A0A3E5DND4_9BACT|nr:hypothetical protein [Segatella copri]RGN78186.1 hypothetical protein DXB41_15055 [Segatella copri]RGS11904.1 hypothetical protein DWY11_13555 [Segatella copri]